MESIPRVIRVIPYIVIMILELQYYLNHPPSSFYRSRVFPEWSEYSSTVMIIHVAICKQHYRLYRWREFLEWSEYYHFCWYTFACLCLFHVQNLIGHKICKSTWKPACACLFTKSPRWLVAAGWDNKQESLNRQVGQTHKSFKNTQNPGNNK